MPSRISEATRDVLEPLWRNPEVSMHDIGIVYQCSMEAVRKAAREMGLPPRHTLVKEHPPVWEISDDEDVVSEVISERAERVRAMWTPQEEAARRVTKAQSAVGIRCIGGRRDVAEFSSAQVPSFMDAPLRTDRQVRDDTKKDTAA